MAERAMALNFHISFSGIVTFKNAKPIQDAARRVPTERLLVETDSPYWRRRHIAANPTIRPGCGM